MSEASEVPGQILTDTVRVPTREEISHLAKMLSGKDHTVEILYMPQPFNARLANAKQDDFTSLPAGYMVNIYMRSEKDRNSFYTELAENSQEGLRDIFKKLGIEDAKMSACIYTQDRNVEPHKGVHIDRQTMGRICAAIEAHEIEHK